MVIGTVIGYVSRSPRRTQYINWVGRVNTPHLLIGWPHTQQAWLLRQQNSTIPILTSTTSCSSYLVNYLRWTLTGNVKANKMSPVARRLEQRIGIFSFLFFLLWNDVQLQPKLLDWLVLCSKWLFHLRGLLATMLCVWVPITAYIIYHDSVWSRPMIRNRTLLGGIRAIFILKGYAKYYQLDYYKYAWHWRLWPHIFLYSVPFGRT